MSHDGLSSDEYKVMDVSRPGKGKIMPTSRPVVAPVVSGDHSEVVKDIDDEIGSHRVTGSQRVIEPLGNMDHNDHSVEDSELKDDTSEPEETGKEAEELNNEAEPVSDNEPSTNNSQTGSEMSDAAEVDALASKVEAKKQAAKEAKEKAESDARLQEMIDSRQYVVPIKGGRSSLSIGLLAVVIAVLLVIAAAIASYFLLNA